MTGNESNLSDTEKRAALMIARGYSHITTAHVLGMQEKTLHFWLQNPLFRKAVKENRNTSLYHHVGVPA